MALSDIKKGNVVMTEKLKYGNWIRKKVLLKLGLSTLGMGVLGILPLHPVFRILAGVLGIVLFISFLYPLYAYYMFSPHGGNIQEKVYDLIVASLGEGVKARVLDIGAGNGILTIKLAQRYPETQVVGLDFWGKDWEYAKSICEENARIAKVLDHVRFVKGDAASLDFGDAAFDAVVSNLTFHEVKSVSQKGDVVREALRVLKPGGFFAFVDYFYDGQYYGQATELAKLLQSLGLTKVMFKPLNELIAMPTPLRHPKILGKVGIVYGEK